MCIQIFNERKMCVEKLVAMHVHASPRMKQGMVLPGRMMVHRFQDIMSV